MSSPGEDGRRHTPFAHSSGFPSVRGDPWIRPGTGRPVEGGINLTLLDGTEIQSVAEAGTRGLGGQCAQSGKLGAQCNEAAGDHRQREVTLARRGAAQQVRQIEFAHHGQHGGDMACSSERRITTASPGRPTTVPPF
jgi:hypothetical protein